MLNVMLIVCKVILIDTYSHISLVKSDRIFVFHTLSKYFPVYSKSDNI